MNYYEHHLGDRERDRRNRALRSQRLAAARALGTHTADQWEALLERFGHRCVRCGCSPERLQKDHIMPIYRGGSDGMENLQPLCQPCNSSKGPETKNWVAHRETHGFDE